MNVNNQFDIGNTPMIPVKELFSTASNLYAKCEYSNPTGSHKDRVYLSIIENLERDGLLKPGMTLIDFTSGNGGAALARLGKLKNYNIKIVIPSKESPDKIRQIQHYNGEIIYIHSDASLGYIASEDLLKARLKAGKIAADNKHYFLDQANSPYNREGCKEIGEEIVEYCKRNKIQPDIFICGIGTGGTISGVAEILKSNFINTKIVGVEPYESNTVYSYIHNCKPRHCGHNLSGIGMGAINGNIVLEMIDDVILIKQDEWLKIMNQSKECGIDLGKTSAACIAAAKKIFLDSDTPQNIITVFFDKAEKYYTEFSNLANEQHNDTARSPINISLYNQSIEDKNRTAACIQVLLERLSKGNLKSIQKINFPELLYDNLKYSLIKELQVLNDIDVVSDNIVHSKSISEEKRNKTVLSVHHFEYRERNDIDSLLFELECLLEKVENQSMVYIVLTGTDFSSDKVIDIISHTSFFIDSYYSCSSNKTCHGCYKISNIINSGNYNCYSLLLKKSFSTVEETICSIQSGKPIIVLDHREDEGDLYIASEKANPENINFLLKARGILCISLLPERMKELDITTATMLNMNLNDTRFGMAIDYLPNCVSGVSAVDRASTVKAVTLPNVKASDFLKNGHVRTLEAMPDGLFDRQGHCEASIDLARIAGLYPSGATCELLDEDGNMMREEELLKFAKNQSLSIIKINQIIRYMNIKGREIDK